MADIDSSIAQGTAQDVAPETGSGGMTLQVPGDWTVERVDGDPGEKARQDIDKMVQAMPELAQIKDDLVSSYTSDLARMKAAGTIFVAYSNLACTDGNLSASVTVSVVPMPDTQGQDVYDWMEETFAAETGVLDVAETRLPKAGRAVQVAGQEPAGNAVQMPGVDLSEAGPLTYLRTLVPAAGRVIDVYCCANFIPKPAEGSPAGASPQVMPAELRSQMFTFFQAMTSTLDIPATREGSEAEA